MSEALQPDPVTSLVYQTFARNLSTTVSAHLRFDIGFTLAASPTGDLKRPSTPPCWIVLRIDPGHLPVVVEMPTGLAKLIIEILLGGQPGAEEEITQLTEIEKHLFGEIIELLASEMTIALARSGTFRVHAERIETEIEMVRAFKPDDSLMGMEMTATAGETPYILRFRHPALFENWSSESEIAPRVDTATRSAGFLDRLSQVEVSFEALLQGPQLPVQELMALEPGDVLRLRHQLVRPIAGYVNGTPQIKGHIVTAGRRRAFLVEP